VELARGRRGVSRQGQSRALSTWIGRCRDVAADGIALWGVGSSCARAGNHTIATYRPETNDDHESAGYGRWCRIARVHEEITYEPGPAHPGFLALHSRRFTGRAGGQTCTAEQGEERGGETFCVSGGAGRRGGGFERYERRVGRNFDDGRGFGTGLERRVVELDRGEFGRVSIGVGGHEPREIRRRLMIVNLARLDFCAARYRSEAGSTRWKTTGRDETVSLGSGRLTCDDTTPFTTLALTNLLRRTVL
jgi:hypothetical protein